MASKSSQHDKVLEQYLRYPYPAPVTELTEANMDGRRRYEIALFWPGGAPKRPTILIAGCGTEQAAGWALRHPNAQVVGIDISASSLAHSARLKDRYALANLELHETAIEDVGLLGLDFDAIVSSGVVHHMAEPLGGLKALAGVLRPRGILNAMVYAKVARYPIKLMQDLFRMLQVQQNDEGISFVRDTLTRLPHGHLMKGIAEQLRAVDFISPSETVDMFLHAREATFTVAETLDLIESAGLRFQRWYDNLLYYPEFHFAPDAPIYRELVRRDDRAIWEAMETLCTVLSQHDFFASRPGVDESIDFGSGDAVHFIPVMDWRFAVEGGDVPGFRRYGWRCNLSSFHVAVINSVDGSRSIREIADKLEAEGFIADDMPALVKSCVWSLHRMGCVAINLPEQCDTSA